MGEVQIFSDDIPLHNLFKVRDEYDDTFTSVLGLRFEISRHHFKQVLLLLICIFLAAYILDFINLGYHTYDVCIAMICVVTTKIMEYNLNHFVSGCNQAEM